MSTLYTKLATVQKELTAVSKGKDNPFFNSKYADINDVLTVLKTALDSAGLVVLQPLGTDETGRGTVITKVIDPESGLSLDSTVIIPDVKDVQKLGGAITYLRRYSLVSMFAMEQLDDDGNAASSAPKKKTATKKVATQNTVGKKPKPLF